MTVTPASCPGPLLCPPDTAPLATSLTQHLAGSSRPPWSPQGHTLSPRHLSHPPAAPGVWHSPSAPPTQITGHRGVPTSLLPFMYHPGDIACHWGGGLGTCHHVTRMSPAQHRAGTITATTPVPTPGLGQTRGRCPLVPSCRGTPHTPLWPRTGAGTARLGLSHVPAVTLQGWRWFSFCF